jgi:hypothetical protein
MSVVFTFKPGSMNVFSTSPHGSLEHRAMEKESDEADHAANDHQHGGLAGWQPAIFVSGHSAMTPVALERGQRVGESHEANDAFLQFATRSRR